MAYNQSPAVNINEQDLSNYSRGNLTVGSTLITPTVKGKSFIPA